MQLEKGNIWDIYSTTDIFLFTANATVKSDCSLVMGRGLAQQVRDHIPGIDLEIGTRILTGRRYRKYGQYFGITVEYLLVIVPFQHPPAVGAFQVKGYYSDPATLELIVGATQALTDLALSFTDKRFDMNFPGIGAGRLERDAVLPIISHLPDNVHIWEFGY